MKTKSIILFFLLIISGFSLEAQRMKEYVIEIEINTTKEKVWEVITDFNNYPNWNTVLNIEGSDSLTIDNKFDITIHKSEKKEYNFTGVVENFEEKNSFGLSKTFLAKWFSKMTHYFIIESIDEEKTKFIQKWKAQGFISSLFWKQICKDFEKFNKMNDELKKHIENNHSIDEENK